MITEQETYKKAFVAAELPLQLLQCWWFYGESALVLSRIGDSLPEFPHMTMYYLGDIEQNTLKKIKSTLRGSVGIVDRFLGVKIRPEKISVIGNENVGNYLVISLQISENLMGIRQRIEHHLPEFSERNLPFKPHFNLGKIKPEQINEVLNFVAKIKKEPENHGFVRLEKIGVFCKGEAKNIQKLYSINL